MGWSEAFALIFTDILSKKMMNTKLKLVYSGGLWEGEIEDHIVARGVVNRVWIRILTARKHHKLHKNGWMGNC